MRTHRLEREQHVSPPPNDAFEFYADALRLEEVTPPWLRFRVVTQPPIHMHPGARIDYRLRLHGVPIRWRTRIERWEPGRRFVDVQVSGPYRLWHHTHEFGPDGLGGTIIRDVVRYALPLGPVGAIAHALVVRRDLERIFDFRRDAVERLLGPQAS
jgi:ligand-binding SRPBCC domain-containing protein